MNTAALHPLLTNFSHSLFTESFQTLLSAIFCGQHYWANGSQLQGLTKFRQRNLSWNLWISILWKNFGQRCCRKPRFFQKHFFQTVTLGKETSGGNLPLQSKMHYYQAKSFFRLCIVCFSRRRGRRVSSPSTKRYRRDCRLQVFDATLSHCDTSIPSHTAPAVNTSPPSHLTKNLEFETPIRRTVSGVA